MKVNLKRITSQRYDLLWLTLATAAITLIMFLSGLWGSDGHLAAPLDDTFIHFQYAKQLAAGHAFQYNTGDPPSSGDSAFIYPFMLAPAYWLGLGGMKALLYADLLNFAAHLLLVILMYKLGFALGGRLLALFSASFVLLDGALNWVFLTGMETGIYAAGLVAFFWVWLRDVPARRFYWLALVGTFVALIRPEGHVLISIACVLTAAYLWWTRGPSWNESLLLIPILAGLIPYIGNLAMTGYWQFNTASSKSIWYVPYSPLREKLSLTVGYGITALKQTYLGLEIGRSPFPLLAAPLVVLGMFRALKGRAVRRRYQRVLAVPYVGVDAGRPANADSSVSAAHPPATDLGYANNARTRGVDRSQTRFLHVLLIITLLEGIGLALLLPPLHFNRYYMPYNPIVWLYLATGLLALIRFSTRRRNHISRFTFHNQRSPALVFAIVALLCLPEFIGYFFAFGDSVRDIYYQQMTFSEWVRRYTPPDARIAVNDTGAHKYLGDRYILDLIGLTNNDMRGAYFSGWGTIFDRLLVQPENERPTYLLIHPNVFVNGIDESVSQSFLTPIYSMRIQNPIITAGDTEMLYKVNWGAALLDPRGTYLLQTGKTPLDMINIGDLGDERVHSYRMEARLSSIGEPKSIVTTAPYEEGGFTMTESGRRHSGWEEFKVRSVPGQPLTMVMRTRLAPGGEQKVLVSANGHEVGVWDMVNEPGSNWQEYQYTIPADLITSDTTTVRVDSTFDPGGPGFSNYRYWFFSP